MSTTTTTPSVHFERAAGYPDEITAPQVGVRFLEIPKRRYLMIEGSARPGEKGFRDAISTLYPVAYTLHFALKRRRVEAPVGGLEGLYWVGKPGPIPPGQFAAVSKRWSWRLMLPVPDAATAQEVKAAIHEVRTKKHPPLIDELKCSAWEEGKVAQTMHVGAYSEEAATINRLHDAIEARGLEPRGCHHEIYISDPNRTKAERMKTLIRQPAA